MDTKKERFVALDVLRGLTMVIMALDHARDFFSLGWVYYAPTDIQLTNLEVFFTRWITHFAAPTFIFLAGIGLYFASGRRTKNQLAFLAISRGLWLIFLELTFVGFFWSFSSEFLTHPKVAVLFAIGVCMVAMGVLVYLPKYLIAIIAVVMVFGHNCFDAVSAESFEHYQWLWMLLHQPSEFAIGSINVRVVYPFIPWIGVMAIGYLFGPVVKFPRFQRKRVLFYSGSVLVLFSIFLRFLNIYGDPAKWQFYDSFDKTFMSFLNFTKYPPSLVYLTFFIGFALVLMAMFDKEEIPPLFRPLKEFGQVPFFFYVLHIPILHLGGIVLANIVFHDASWLYGAPISNSPQGYSYGSELIPTYLAWITVCVGLYFPSKWFANLKANRKDWWLSYL